jgi:hypothetical protein
MRRWSLLTTIAGHSSLMCERRGNDMNAITHRVPASQSDDPSEVVEALDVARALWDKGERNDAIRWVRRAVEAADQAGNTLRMASLARAAADLEQASHPPPPVARPSKPPPPLPAKARGASVPPAPPPAPPSAPAARTATRIDPAPPASMPRSATLIDAAPPPPPAPPAVAAPPARTVAQQARSVPQPVAPPAPQAAAHAAPQPAPETRLRVSVRKSARDPALFVVRPLPDGQAPPPGTREAYLVMPDGSGDDTSGPKRGGA